MTWDKTNRHGHSRFEVQGHRGARGLLPENTLPSFEIALDVGVDSLETDVHLSRDDVAVLFHDEFISSRVCTVRTGHEVPAVESKPLVRSLSLSQLRGYRADGEGTSRPMPLAQLFATLHGIDPYDIPTLMELFAFVQAYAGSLGEQAGKTLPQREHAQKVIFDIELKRMPFYPQTTADQFDGVQPATLERQVVAEIQRAGVVARSRVRSFDHRSLRAVKRLEPSLPIALLIHHTAPAQIGHLLASCQAELYCPDFHFVDEQIVQQVHNAGQRIIPYTVNEPHEWETLVGWGVDGITTDYPDRLRGWLDERRSRLT